MPTDDRLTRHSSFLVLTLVSLFTVGMPGALAQVESQPTPVPAIAQSASSRISINVLVDDKLGHPVLGLKAEDFTLLDNKQAQKLVDFRARNAGNPADAVHVIIVIDMINSGFSGVAWDREQLGEFLKQDGGKLANPTSLAVLAESGLKVGHAYTQDGNDLMAGFDQIQSSLRTINRSGGVYGLAEMLDMSLKQFGQLAAFEATQPGRKMILVISPGWPMLTRQGDEEDAKQRAWVFNTIVGFSNGLLDGKITVYCLDPHIIGRTNPFYYESFLKPVALWKNAEYPDLALQVLAAHSGGLALIQSHDIAGELNTAIRDAAASYELTFEAAPGDRIDEYHALQVQVDKPDVKVRTTAGYYAHVQSITDKTK